MAEIFKLFSNAEETPKTHNYESANRLMPLIRRYTEEAHRETEALAAKLAYFQKNTAQYKAIAREYDSIVAQWVKRIHRLGALAKGLWLVDFDTGAGYLCWVYPEERVEYFHSYESGFKGRTKLSDLQSSLFIKPKGGRAEPPSPQPSA